MEILKIENLTFKYPLCKEPALCDISLSIEKGEFTVICGATGSGKSTLLHMLKRELTPMGERSGNILYCGKPLETVDSRTSACDIGYVMQRPEEQPVTDKVWHELAFGLENMHIPQNVIRRRVSEICAFFGIEDWFDKDIAELSGGQKQLLNLAAVMVMQPKILIVDEPTAQLDPIAASDFIGALQKLNRELSLTVIAVEHRLEDIVPICDKLLVLDRSRLLTSGKPREVIDALSGNAEFMCGMPAAARLYCRFGISSPCPLTVREGRRFVEEHFGNSITRLTPDKYIHSAVPALEFRDVWFRYSRSEPDVLRGTELTVYENEIVCLLGGNGSGKTTALGAAAGINRIYAGSIRVFGRSVAKYASGSLYRNCLAYLPQDVQTVFLKNTVREELSESGVVPEDLPYDLSDLLDRHPYDISGGEQQLVALAKVLALKPRLLLLDEPTKGLDAAAKLGIADILEKLKRAGVAVLAVTHDVEFAALCADRCALFFRGEITSSDVPSVFFSENAFYTTAINRMTRGYYENAVTVDDAVKLCRANSVGCESDIEQPRADSEASHGVD